MDKLMYRFVNSLSHEDRVTLFPLCYTTQGLTGNCRNSIATNLTLTLNRKQQLAGAIIFWKANVSE